MRLTVGQEAPRFTATSVAGEPVELKQLFGRPIWLMFFRFALCPLCNLRVHQLVAHAPRFAKYDASVLAIFQSPREKLEGLVARQRPPFAVIPDPEMGLYRLYGVESGVKGLLSMALPKQLVQAAKLGFPIGRPSDGPATRIPADFLIDREGKIHTAFYGTHIGGHIPLDDAVRFLSET